MKKPNGMTVSELIEILKDFDKNCTVAFAYPSGDYWHTEIAGEVDTVNDAYVKWTEYHEKFRTLGFDEVEDEDSHHVVILGGR